MSDRQYPNGQPKGDDRNEQDIVAVDRQIDEARKDTTMRERVRAIIERDRDILEDLAK